MNRILLLLAVMLAVSIVKAEEFECDGLIYEVNENPEPNPLNPRKTLTVKKANGKIEGILTIPASVSYNGQELPVRRIGERAFYDNGQLTGVNFPDMLQYIDSYAFHGTGILSLDLSQTRIREIGYGAFGGCKNLSDVKLPTVGDCAIIRAAFEGCDAIKSLIVPPSCRVESLPPKIEELYTVSVYNIMYGYQSDVDLTNVVLHVPQNEMQTALETFGDKCKGYKIWDFEVVNRIEPDLTGFETENFFDGEIAGERTAFYATVGKPTRLSFKIFPEDALFKSVYVDRANTDFSFEYDGEDTVIFTMNSLDSYDYNNHLPIYLFTVRAVYGDKYSFDTYYKVYVFQNPDPDYPVSIGFKHPQIRIKPFEFYYQPVEFYPEGSTILPVSWQSSDPEIATVTKDGKVYPLVEEGTVEIMATAIGDNGNLSASYTAIIDKDAAAVDNISIDEDSNRVYYNLQGVKVAEENLTLGTYIVISNGISKKL